MDTDPSSINGLIEDSNEHELKPKINWDDEEDIAARSRARATEKYLAVVNSATTPPIDLRTVKEEEIRPQIEFDDAAEQDAFEWLESTVNPKLKKKSKLEDVPIQTIHRYMKPIPTFDVDRERGIDIDLAVPRGFISRQFGGSPQGAFPKVREDKRREMIRDGFGEAMFNFMNWDYHPYMPTRPGFPGLYLNICSADEMEVDDLKYDWETTKEAEDEEVKVKVEDEERKRGEEEDYDVHRVFVRLDANQWLYVGQYKIEHRAILSKEEWDELSYAVGLSLAALGSNSVITEPTV
ncbi:hypothetical protein E1B28_008519 [Marasmius oreades]|uniref:DUF6697 domain-containing protein n=1 Tax=Marasmius oreades TaxID=181124 RepID=A0A9P7UTD4_9AGAR|nr:uncharacterized protein E1B28_008519 [Marasmius oreades]KAG7092146.1 hypothetical protein E1B28_008519 [Marasmius oreades]